jgi:uncharacterized protein (TIGR03083 family)
MTETHNTYVDWLEMENRAFVDAARLGLDAPVPTCPGWLVKDLVLHHASFQLWITALIVDRVQEPIAPSDAYPPFGIDVLDWYQSIGDEFVRTLRLTDPSTPVWGVTGEQRAGAWARRQASETSVHRWDAQNAQTIGRPIEHADDYLGELFTLLLPSLIRSFGAVLPLGTLMLRSTDHRLTWSVRPLGGTIELAALSTEPDVQLTGTSSDLFLALWRRPSAVRVEGDLKILGQWQAAIAGD